MADEMPTWREYPMAAIILEPGSTAKYKTGDWRSRRPVLDSSKCLKSKCARCWIYCPDAARRVDEDGYFEVDLSHCKGCGICARECPPGAITMVEEGE